LRLFFVFLERERKAGAAFLSLCDAVGSTSGADEQRFMEESPPRAEGEKVLPLQAELDVKSGGHVEGDPQATGPGSPLMAIATSTSSPPPGGSPTSRPGLPLMAMETKGAATASLVSDGRYEEGHVTGDAV
jgi:hypothetical protein